ASGPRPGASTSCTSTTAATRSTPVPTGTPTSVRATSPPTTSSRWSATPVPRPSSRPRAPRSSGGPTSGGCGGGSADSGPGEQLGGLPPRRGDRRGRRRLQALGRELDQVGEHGLRAQGPPPGELVRPRPTRTVHRTRSVRGYELVTVGSGEGDRAGRAPARGAGRGSLAQPAPGELVQRRPPRTVHCTSSVRGYEFVGVGGGEGVRAGGRWPGDARAGRDGPGWGTRAPGAGQGSAPEPRLANSYNRAQLVRCTVRARYGATSSRPRRIHGGSTADPRGARPDRGQAAPGLCRPGRGPRYSAMASLAASCACARASAPGMRPANMSGK